MINVIVYDENPEIRDVFREVLSGSDGLGRIFAAKSWTEVKNAAEDRPSSVVVLGPDADSRELDQTLVLAENSPGTAFVQVVDAMDAQALQQAMRRGIKAVVAVDQVESDLVSEIRRAHAMARSQRGRAGSDGDKHGKVVAVFGSKGGTGKTMLATNLAVLAANERVKTVLVDANVAYGDCAAFLRVRPERTLTDLASIPGELDESALKSALTAHGSGLQLLCAGNDPLAAESLDTGLVGRLLSSLRQHFELIIVDTSSTFDTFSQAVLAECDLAYLVTSIELPAIKDARVCLSTFERLQLPTEKVRVVLNRANSKVGFPPEEVDRALGRKVTAKLPSHISVPRAINNGVVVSEESSRSPVARALNKMASDLRQELLTNGHPKTKKLALGKGR